MARRQLRRYRRKGPAKTTTMLLEALERTGVQGANFLDVGGGVGAIQHELMSMGAASGTSVEASPAYLESAREEAASRGYADRMRYVEADLVEAGTEIEPADLVTLDRVVCCYPDMPGLVDASASKARRAYGLVYPRDIWVVRFGLAALNFVQRLRRHPFRAFVHPTAAVEKRVATHGLRKTFQASWTVWQVALFTRADDGATPSD